MAERRLLIVHFGDAPTPKILSLRSDRNGYIALGNRSRKFAIESVDSWNALQDELKRCCGCSRARCVFLHSLDRPTKSFKCVRDIFDDPCVVVRVQATLDELGTAQLVAKLAEQQVTSTPHHSRGNRRSIELRRAETGLARARRMLFVGPADSCTTRTSSNSICNPPLLRSTRRRTSVGAERVKPNPPRLTARRHVVNAYPDEGVSRPDFMYGRAVLSNESNCHRVPKKPLSLEQVYSCLPSRRPGFGRSSGVPDPPKNVSVAGLFGQGVYLLWHPVWLDVNDCNNGCHVLGYKVFINGQLEALAEGPLSSHVVLYELEPEIEYEILVRTRCHGVDSNPSEGIKYRVSSSSGNAYHKVQSLTAGSLAQLETVQLEAYDNTDQPCRKEAVSERSISTSSSSGIVTDDALFGSPPPRPTSKRRPRTVIFTPGDAAVYLQPDPPTGVCVTEEDGLLTVKWNPVNVQVCQSNNGHVVIGYKVYGNGKLKARARGSLSRQAFLLVSNLRDEDLPVVITVKTRGIVCDSIPSEEYSYWPSPSNAPSSSDFHMLKSDSKDSFYSTDHSRHTSMSEESATATVFTQSSEDLQSVQSSSFDFMKHDHGQDPPLTSTAKAKLSDLVRTVNYASTCHQLVRPPIDMGLPCLETSV